MNKSNTNININKSHDLSKFSNKYNNNSSKHKIFLSGISNMKSFGSTTNSSYNINKSANLVGKSRQKLKYATKKDNNINTKSLQYISNLNNKCGCTDVKTESKKIWMVKKYFFLFTHRRIQNRIIRKGYYQKLITRNPIFFEQFISKLFYRC